MTGIILPAIDAERRIRRRAARTAVIVLASLSLLIAIPSESFGRAKKPETRQSQPTVAKIVAKRHIAKPRPAAGKAATRKTTAKAVPSRPSAPALRSAILIDAATGTVLSETKPDMVFYPASLTKMMTLYLTFTALNDSRLRLDQLLPVSSHAAAQAPIKLWLKPGDAVPVQTLILALVTRSANDASVVLAEALGGSEAAFAARMTETAHRLGMRDTVFRNASGLPDPQQHSTARDLARLSLALLQDFPREYGYFSTRAFEFRGRTIRTHNHTLGSYTGADGIKTGFTRASGFNLAASAERNGHRLIGVVLGSPSWPTRDREMAAMLDRGFITLGTTRVAGTDTVEPAPGRSKPAGLVTRLALHTAPIGKALAAPKAKPAIRRATSTAPARSGNSGDRTIQLGAFRARAAAVRLAGTAAQLKPVRGKNIVIRRFSGDGKGTLYAVRVSDFTDSGARDACGALRQAKLACFVVPQASEG